MSAPASRTRRELIATVSGGALLGALWGAAFPMVATERRPTISVVGHKNAQVALIDTTEARAIIMTGEPDDELMDALPAMMTVFRQRIDILIGEPNVLANWTKRLAMRWRIRHAVEVPGSAGALPLPLPTTIVDDLLEIELGSASVLSIRLGSRAAWQSVERTRTSPFWCATLHTPAGDAIFAPDVASVISVGPTPAALMFVPDSPPAEVLAVSPATALGVNFDSASLDRDPGAGHALTRIYPRDVARYVIGHESFELPGWTALHDRDATD